MAASPYDVKFTITSGASYGFMLSTPSGASKQLTLSEVMAPDAARVSNSAGATHQDFDPQLDTPFSMDSFVSGLGQIPFDNGDEQMVWWGSGVVTHVDGKAYLAPPTTTEALSSATGAVNGFYSYVTSAGARYDFCWSGQRIYRRDAANGTNDWSVAYNHGSQTITDFKVFNGVGLIAVPTDSTNDFYRVTANLTSGTMTATATNHTPFGSGVKPKFWQAVRGTLYALVDSGKVFFTVDPSTDGWMGPISVTLANGSSGPDAGDSSYVFNNVAATGDYLFTFSPSAGYNIDSEQIVSEVFAQWRDKPATTNFRFVATNPLGLYLGVGNEVYLYDPQTGATTPLGLGKAAGFGCKEILGVTAQDQYVYILARVRVPTLRSADSVALLRAYRLRGARWGFECLWEDTSVTETYYNLAAFPSATGTRLYWGVTTGGATSTILMEIPSEWDETTAGTYAASGILYTSISRAHFPGFIKRHLWFSMETDGTTSSSNKVTVAYSTDNGATWTTLGDTGSGSASTLITRIDFSAVSSRSIALRFTFASAGTVTPVLRVFDQHQRVRYRYAPSGTVTVRVADNIELNTGSTDPRSKEVLRAALQALRTSDSEITYEDFLGNSWLVSVDNLMYAPTRHHIPNGKPNVYELEAAITFNRADAGL